MNFKSARPGAVSVLSKPRVVVAEDEAEQLNEICVYLEERGIEVARALTAEAAKELVDKYHPKVALIDIRLGGQDGILLAESIKKHDPACDIILMSGYQREVYRANKSSKAPFAVIDKPIPLQALSRFLMAVLAPT